MIAHPAFVVEPWRLRETAFSPEVAAQTESLFALSNGYLGLRGTLDEGAPVGRPGTFLNGFHERRRLHYPERGYGWAEEGQHLLNVSDAKTISCIVDGEALDVRRGNLLSHERVLDLRRGTLRRRLGWRAPSGRLVRVESERLVALGVPQVAAVHYRVTAVDGPVELGLASTLVGNESVQVNDADPRSSAALHGRVLLPRAARAEGTRALLVHRTRQSHLVVAAGVDHRLEGGAAGPPTVTVTDDRAECVWHLHLPEGGSVTLTKFAAYHWAPDGDPDGLARACDASLDELAPVDFEALAADQRAALARFWAVADVEVDGDPEIQQAVRFGLFHLFQATACAGGRAVAAKGLTGQGYDGHAFWDTEAFVVPVLTAVAPELARAVLAWRVAGLDQARADARIRSERGAKFPWRTITGDEASAYFPAGEAALHVNADVAVAIARYVRASGDEAFLAEGGAEVLVETARFWRTRGHRDPDRGGAFCIDGVTGPDEYSALVDNNVYTNLMAARNLREAAWALETLDANAPAAAARLRERLGLDEAEPTAWLAAADAMHVPFDPDLGIHPQDADFCRHEPWDFAGTPPARYPLMLHYPYASLYRRQVVKQADLVLALYLCPDAFAPDQRRANFEHYEGLTVRDSSLSASIQGVVAAEVGHLGRAYAYLREAAAMDLEDLEHNTADGLHLAALAGAWIALVAGAGGLREEGEDLAFSPRLLGPITRLAFRLRHRGRLLRVTAETAEVTYALEEGAPLEIHHHGALLRLRVGREVHAPVPPAPELPEPPSVPGRAPERRGRS